MGIDIYARWKDQTGEEEEAQYKSGFDATVGHVGYLREAYHGEPYATRYLVSEAFESGHAYIPAKRLRARLPETLRLAEERERTIYGAKTTDEIEPTLRSYTAFVELCERMEAKTGQPVKIIASY